MIIFSHRGNTQGPNPAKENSLQSISKALTLGFGIETDVRCDKHGAFYISHDPSVAHAETLLEKHATLWRSAPSSLVALNIKELGAEIELVVVLERLQVMSQTFLFDMELLEPEAGQTSRLYFNANPNMKLAARISDRYESIDRALNIKEASIIWLDEFDTQWATASDMTRLKAAGKKIYAVSPELHGYPIEVATRRWHDFSQWGVDGICTDWPIKLRKELD